MGCTPTRASVQRQLDAERLQAQPRMNQNDLFELEQRNSLIKTDASGQVLKSRAPAPPDDPAPAPPDFTDEGQFKKTTNEPFVKSFRDRDLLMYRLHE